MIKKLKRVEVEGKLKSLGLLVFTPQEFKDIFGVARGAASVFISHNTGRDGVFLKLRNGLYLVKDASVSSLSLANKIYEPSYISKPALNDCFSRVVPHCGLFTKALAFRKISILPA